MSLPPPPVAPTNTSERCYRHPDRETGRNCTRCGRPACSDCLTPAPIGAHCVDCAKADRPGLVTRARYAGASQPLLVTFGLIGINVALFIMAAVQNPQALSGAITPLHQQLDLFEPSIVLNRQYYRLLTSGFMHFGVIHIVFNMWMLYLMGQVLERGMGRVRFPLLYFAALFGGSFGVIILDNPPDPSGFSLTAGASGAIFGLLGAATVGQLMNGMNPLNTSIGRLLIFNVAFTFIASGVSVGGHLGGLVAGGICGTVMLSPRHKQPPQWVVIATPLVVGAVAIAGSILLAKVPGLA